MMTTASGAPNIRVTVPPAHVRIGPGRKEPIVLRAGSATVYVEANGLRG